MLRDKLNEAMKEAMRARDQAALGTIRLILAKLKDVDIAARTEASREGVADDKILSMMQGMIKQRNESIALYEKGNRADLADKEKAEIAVIERFLPQQMDEAAVAGRRARGHRRRRRHLDQGHGRRHGGAEGQVCRPDGLRQGVGRGEEGSRRLIVPAIPLWRGPGRWDHLRGWRFLPASSTNCARASACPTSSAARCR